MTIVDQLHKAIKDCGLSQRQLARECDISQPTLSYFTSHARSGMSLETAARIADYLGLELAPKRRSAKNRAAK